MPPPTTAGQLQTFLCCSNWMRSHIPSFAQVVSPLMTFLDSIVRTIGSRKQKKLDKVMLRQFGWTEEHATCFADIKTALIRMVPLGHPREDTIVSLFADASQGFWGSVVTQIPPEDAKLPFNLQRHQPLAFLSGRFSGAPSRWPIPDKEAFTIVESCKRLEYILLQPAGFVIYTDHRNLVYLFNPQASDSNMQRHLADRLLRWAMALSGYKYNIVHIPGEDNIWADMLSRWHQKPTENPESNGASESLRSETKASDQRTTPPYKSVHRPLKTTSKMNSLTIPPTAPLQPADFVWPAWEDIKKTQEYFFETPSATKREVPQNISFSHERMCLCNPAGRIWILPSAANLKYR